MAQMEVGGDVFDEAIMNRLVQNVRMSRQLDGSVETYQGAKARLMAGCERAKIGSVYAIKCSHIRKGFFPGDRRQGFRLPVESERA